MGSDSDEIGLNDAYSVSGPEENRELYARWASTYEESFIAAEGYRYHQRVAAIYSETGGVGPVLDIGCGTGVVGFESHLDTMVTERRIGGYELVSIPIYDDAETSDPDRVSNVAVSEVS